MLIPILGRSGSGKTTYLFSQIREKAKTEKKLMLIVPEQFSFEMEKAVYRALDSTDALKVEVYSFTRLCHKIFSTCGGIAGDRISDAAKQILMSLALDRVKDQLTFYAKPARSVNFVSSMLKAVDEFKNAGVSPDRLNEFSATTDNLQLSQKVGELSQVYQFYQTLVEASYLDEKDSLSKCCELLEGESFFEGYTVFIDSFMTFMAGEMQMIQLMLQSCKVLYLAMPTDSIDTGFYLQKSEHNAAKTSITEPMDDGTFDVVKQTTLQIIQLAKRLEIPVMAPIKLKGEYRFANPELAHLERSMTETVPTVYHDVADAVEIIKARDPFDEMQYVAAKIANLVRDNNLAYHDIAIIGRSMELYTTSIDDLFPKYEIPFFMDLREDIQSVPVISAVLSALEAVRSNYDTQYMLALGKSTLLGIDYTDLARLENYCYIWTVNHKQWVDGTGFQNNPRGLVPELTEKDKEELDIIQRTAHNIAEPIETLKQEIAQCTGGEFAQAIFRFLTSIHAQENLARVAQKNGEIYDRYLQLNQGAWDILMDILDIFFTTMQKIYLPQDRFIDLLKMGILCSDIGSIPNTLDQVSIGTADRMRPNAPKVTFIIGANQGEFPPQLAENGLFSDLERDELFDGGIQLNPSVLRRNSYEQYFIYSAISSPSQQLIITYHHALLTGKLTEKSNFVSTIQAIFPCEPTSTEDLPPRFFIANEQTAFDQLCRSIRKDTAFTTALINCISTTDYAARFSYIVSVLQQNGFLIRNREIAQMLFGENMRLSPSKIENYFLCPFSYFCSGGLKLKVRHKVEFSPMQSGTIIHFVLEKMVSQHGGKGLSKLLQTQILDEVRQLLQEFLRDRVTQEESLTKRFHYLFIRLANTLTRLLIQLGREFAQSEFEPYAFELSIQKDEETTEEVSALELKTADGKSIIVEGIIDRVDLMEKDGVRYVRVVDYKSGSKEFKLDDVYYGLNLQMLIYLFTIWQNGRRGLENCIPAGVLYMPAKDHMIPAQRHTSDEDVEKAHQKKYKMNGLVLENPVCIAGMEQKTEGIFIPVKTKADGSLDARSSVASLAQMGAMRQHIEKLLKEMVENLSDGKIQAKPAYGLGYEACLYCDYKTICQHQENDETKTLEELGRKQFFDILAEEKPSEQASKRTEQEERHDHE